MKWTAPLARGGVAWYVEGVCAADVDNYGLAVGEGHVVARGDDVGTHTSAVLKRSGTMEAW